MNEEMEAIRAMEEFEREQKESEIRRQYREELKKKEEFIKFKRNQDRKIAFRKFVPILLGGAIVASIGTYMGKSENIKQLIAASQLQAEVTVHGGYKINNEYVANFERHIEKECELNGEGSIEERIKRYCIKNDLSDEICDLAIQKFNCYYNDDFENGDLINLVNEVKLEQKEEENNTYGMN